MQLHLHPDDKAPGVGPLVGRVERDGQGGLVLHWQLETTPGSLQLPPPGAGERRDGLWHHSCFEAFVGFEDGFHYHEFNFSPSGDWAAYRFSARRQDMRDLELAAAPRSRWERSAHQLHLSAWLPPLADYRAGLRIGLYALLRLSGGAMSHWAISHPPGAPDFHHEAGRVLRLGPAGTAAPGGSLP